MGNVLKRESGSIPSVAKDCRGWGLITRPVRHTIMASPARTFVPFVTFCRFFDPCLFRVSSVAKIRPTPKIRCAVAPSRLNFPA